MFSVYTNLNEGRCASSDRKCTERKLSEGENPRLKISRKEVHVNSRWEKLRK